MPWRIPVPTAPKPPAPDTQAAARRSARRRRIAGGLRWFGVLVSALLVFQIFVAPVYEFPPATPFQGRLWYDPYAGPRGPWLRANIHAHTSGWMTFSREI